VQPPDGKAWCGAIAPAMLLFAGYNESVYFNLV
jgi:hypothetical protein